MMIKQVDRYVGNSALTGTLVMLLGTTLLFMLFTVLSELRNTSNDYGTGDVFWYVAMLSPKMAYKIFPVSALLGTLTGVGSLAVANELMAFRTAGVSRLRLAGAALAGVMLVTIPVLVIGEWVAPDLEQQARGYKLNKSTGLPIIGGSRGIWMRDGNNIVNIQSPVMSMGQKGQAVEFNQVVIYGFDESLQLESITRAANAAPAEEGWELTRVYTVNFDDNGAWRKRSPTRSWLTEVKPELLDSAVTRPWRLSIRALVDYIQYLWQNGLDDKIYVAAFWEKVFFPLNVITLVLAGMPFVFSSVRSHNLGMRLFIGMTIGGVFTIINKGVQNFAAVYQLSSLLSTILPSILIGLAAILALRRSV
jgi:lipopolysaccharide export system permease protein